MTEKKTQSPASAAAICVAALCPSVKAANRAFEAIVHAGAAPASVSVVARGIEVDRHLIADTEMNANRLASPGKESFHLSALARKLAGDRRLLLDGCWAAGPVFHGHAGKSGAPGLRSLVDALSTGGLSKEEAVRFESALKGPGGVWLIVSGETAHCEAIERSLRSIEGVDVTRKALREP